MTTADRRSSRRRLGVGALVLSVALMLGGCMKVDVDLSLNEDDTADGVFVMGVADEVADMLGQDPQTLWDEMGTEMESDLPDGATTEPYSADGYTGTRVSFEDQPLAEVDAGGGTGEALSITREGDDYVVSGAMDMSDDASELQGLPESFAESFDFRVAVTFPGEVTEHNGTLEGRTVVWEPQLGERNEISARGAATASGGDLPWVWILLAGLVLIAVGGVVAGTAARSRRAETATQTEDVAEEPAYPHQEQQGSSRQG